MKENLVSTPLYRPLLQARSTIQYLMVMLSNKGPDRKTAYCISPFKSGTTYFAGLFSEASKSEHEPLMHATLSNINNEVFMKKRAGYLNLDLECSGFFAGKLEVLRRISPDAKVIYLTRHPEEWIGSVVNYFSRLGKKLHITMSPVLYLILYVVGRWTNFMN